MVQLLQGVGEVAAEQAHLLVGQEAFVERLFNLDGWGQPDEQPQGQPSRK